MRQGDAGRDSLRREKKKNGARQGLHSYRVYFLSTCYVPSPASEGCRGHTGDKMDTVPSFTGGTV